MGLLFPALMAETGKHAPGLWSNYWAWQPFFIFLAVLVFRLIVGLDANPAYKRELLNRYALGEKRFTRYCGTSPLAAAALPFLVAGAVIAYYYLVFLC